MKNRIIAALVIMSLAACQSSEKNSDKGQLSDSSENESTLSLTVTENNEHGQKSTEPNSNSAGIEMVKGYLQKTYKKDLETQLIDSNSRKFIVSEYDLNDDGEKEIFVRLTGSYFCGSGGCTALLLNKNGELITSFTVVGYPVFAAETKTKNWKDLVMFSNGKNHLVKFTGSKYPSNPSIEPEAVETKDSNMTKVFDVSANPEQWSSF